MLRNIDRYAGAKENALRLGDTARFPRRRLGDTEIYPYTWEDIAFGGPAQRHLVHIERRHDKLRRAVSQFWFAIYQIDA